MREPVGLRQQEGRQDAASDRELCQLRPEMGRPPFFVWCGRLMLDVCVDNGW